MLCNLCGNVMTDEEAHAFFLPIGEICEECHNEIKLLDKDKQMATYHGITKAICLNCGKVTTDETQLEILNDLDPTCTSCEVHAVAWHSANGVVVTAQKTTEEDADIERFAILEKEVK